MGKSLLLGFLGPCPYPTGNRTCCHAGGQAWPSTGAEQGEEDTATARSNPVCEFCSEGLYIKRGIAFVYLSEKNDVISSP
jgi:hypothetical protein